jgi:hypothetical protein
LKRRSVRAGKDSQQTCYLLPEMTSPQLRAARDRSKAAGLRRTAKEIDCEQQREKVLDIAQQYEDIATIDESERPPTDTAAKR